MWRGSTLLQLNPTSCLIWTTHYYWQFALSLGKESPYMYIFSTFNLLIILKLNVNTFYGLVGVPFNRVWLWFLLILIYFYGFVHQVSMTPTSRAFLAFFVSLHTMVYMYNCNMGLPSTHCSLRFSSALFLFILQKILLSASYFKACPL